ncbi:hypothetical protein QE152_g612 [Popillia japonica]
MQMPSVKFGVPPLDGNATATQNNTCYALICQSTASFLFKYSVCCYRENVICNNANQQRLLNFNLQKWFYSLMK